MTREERRELIAIQMWQVKELRESEPDLTVYEIAQRVGIAETTASSYLIRQGYRSHKKLSERQIEEIRSYRATHPELSLAKVAAALGVPEDSVRLYAPAPERRLRLGHADERITAVYNKLKEERGTVSPEILAKEAGTCLVTARGWFGRHHPEIDLAPQGKRPRKRDRLVLNGDGVSEVVRIGSQGDVLANGSDSSRNEMASVWMFDQLICDAIVEAPGEPYKEPRATIPKESFAPARK